MVYETGCGAQTPYYDRLLEDTESLENLAHSLGFEQLLKDNMSERHSELIIGNINLVHHLLPLDVYEVHGFPSAFNFTVSNFSAELTESPPPDDKPEADLVESLLAEDKGNSWVLTASYSVNGTPYNMNATATETILSMRTEHGDLVRHAFPPQLAPRLMATLAVGMLYELGVPFESDRLGEITETSPEILGRLMKNMGNLNGHYKSELIGCFLMLGIDRALMVTLTETETPGKSEVQVDHRMVWELARSMVSEVVSRQHEAINSNDGQYLSRSWDRFGARQPATTIPDELELGLTDGSLSDEARIFYPGINGAEYSTVNTTIMTILGPLLKQEKYARLDSEPDPNEIYNEHDPAKLVRLEAPDEPALPPEDPPAAA